LIHCHNVLFSFNVSLTPLTISAADQLSSGVVIDFAAQLTRRSVGIYSIRMFLCDDSVHWIREQRGMQRTSSARQVPKRGTDAANLMSRTECRGHRVRSEGDEEMTLMEWIPMI
jgi:hypothetical protein